MAAHQQHNWSGLQVRSFTGEHSVFSKKINATEPCSLSSNKPSMNENWEPQKGTELRAVNGGANDGGENAGSIHTMSYLFKNQASSFNSGNPACEESRVKCLPLPLSPSFSTPNIPYTESRRKQTTNYVCHTPLHQLTRLIILHSWKWSLDNIPLLLLLFLQYI